MVPKFVRREAAEQLRIFLVLALFISTTLVVPPVTALGNSEEVSGPRVKGFSLVRYEDEFTWRLTGKRANEGGGSLVVRDFDLLVRKSEPEKREEEQLFEFSGKELRLNPESGDNVAMIPSEVKIGVKEEFRVIAETAKFNFSTGKVSGTELELTSTGNGTLTSLTGRSFEYDYTGEVLTITGNFQAKIRGAGYGGTEISGDRLTWRLEEEINTKGDVVARTGSGWKLTAETMKWTAETETLEFSGPVVALKGDTRIQGESITYHLKGEKISVNKASMVLNGE